MKNIRFGKQFFVLSLVVGVPATAQAQPKPASSAPQGGGISAEDLQKAVEKAVQLSNDKVVQAQNDASNSEKRAIEQTEAATKAEADKEKEKGEKERAERKLKDAEERLELLKNGKLISYGITGGMSASVVAGFGKTRQNSPGFATMPYVMVHPAYWVSSQSFREYCASAWSSGSEADAAKAAFGAEKKKAFQFIQALTETIKAGGDGKTLLDEIKDDSIKKAIQKGATELSKINSQAEYDDKKSLLASVLANEEWAPHWTAKCYAHKFFGLWIGKPMGYEAIVTSENPQAKQKIDWGFSAGYGISPNAYLSILTGISLGKFYDDTHKKERNVYGFVLGVGGNLDIFTLLRGTQLTKPVENSGEHLFPPNSHRHPSHPVHEGPRTPRPTTGGSVPISRSIAPA